MTILHNTQWIRKQKAISGTFGLEIETETLDRYPLEATQKIGEYNFPIDYRLNDWKIVEDHSLRNFGYEYVLTKPLDFADTGKALDEFKAKTDKLNINFLQDRHSTSVHVHINFQNETFKTLANYCTMFVLFEEVLVNFCGEERRSNFFCMTSRYAEGVTKRFTSFFHKVFNGDRECLSNLDPEVSKYSSLNIVPLYKQGSIEVRTMRGVTDVALIYNWVGMLNSLLEFARQNISPDDIIDQYRTKGIELFHDVFGKYAVFLEDGNTLGLIEQNLWAASCIACSVPDWNKVADEMMVKQNEYDETVKKNKSVYADEDEMIQMKRAVVAQMAQPARARRVPPPVPMAGNEWVNPVGIVVDDIEEQF